MTICPWDRREQNHGHPPIQHSIALPGWSVHTKTIIDSDSIIVTSLPFIISLPLQPTIMQQVCEKRAVLHCKAPAPAAKKSAGGGGAGGGGGACATSIATPGSCKFLRKSNSAAVASTLAAVSGVVTVSRSDTALCSVLGVPPPPPLDYVLAALLCT